MRKKIKDILKLNQATWDFSYIHQDDYENVIEAIMKLIDLSELKDKIKKMWDEEYDDRDIVIYIMEKLKIKGE